MCACACVRACTLGRGGSPAAWVSGVAMLRWWSRGREPPRNHGGRGRRALEHPPAAHPNSPARHSAPRVMSSGEECSNVGGTCKGICAPPSPLQKIENTYPKINIENGLRNAQGCQTSTQCFRPQGHGSSQGSQLILYLSSRVHQNGLFRERLITERGAEGGNHRAQRTQNLRKNKSFQSVESYTPCG